MSACNFMWSKITVLLIMCAPLSAQALAIDAANSWEAIFANQITHYELVLSGEKGTVALVKWELTAKGRVLSSGQNIIRL
ncbi:MAG: hypothetical protein COC05_06055 [Gammaproteobacteria bacterium]|nr:MAG: hypothetical protein COC05_06055 [Gammaproteobacteria bacterium]